MFLLGLILLILFVITIHEFGHYAAAKYFKVPVKKFSIGLGPTLFKFKDSNQTEWCFSIIPLGGYVEFDETHAQEIAPWKHTVISLAGPAVNFLAVVIPFLILSGFGPAWEITKLHGVAYVEMFKAFYNTITFASHDEVMSIIGVAKESSHSSGTPVASGAATSSQELSPVVNAMIMYVMVNMSVCVFNLLPIVPLDGGHIVKNFIRMTTGKFAETINTWFSITTWALFAWFTIIVIFNDIVR